MCGGLSWIDPLMTEWKVVYLVNFQGHHKQLQHCILGNSLNKLGRDCRAFFGKKTFWWLFHAFSEWLRVHTTASTSSAVTIGKLKLIFATHGLPQTIMNDNATSFTSTNFQHFVQTNELHHITSVPYHPSSNGLAERAVQTLKESIKRIREGT